MDLSYFTAVMKSTVFPPYDPWFAGGYINYYYYGFVFAGVLAKLLGIVPTVAYNLILPMLYSFTGLGVFSALLIIWWLTAQKTNRFGRKRRKSRLVAYKVKSHCWPVSLLWSWPSSLAIWLKSACCLMPGLKQDSSSLENLPLIGTLARTLDGGIKIISGQPAPLYPGDWFWTATRAINYLDGETAPITEFPFFTFLYGDLHAHMISLPLQFLALGWSVALALQSPRSHRQAGLHGGKPGCSGWLAVWQSAS